MIANPRPGSPAWTLLEQLVAHPGELDAEALGEVLEPPPALVLPGPEAGHRARSAAYAAWLDQERGPLGADGRRRGGRRDQASARASRLLGRLQELGLVETRGPPTLAPWFTDRVRRRGTLAALQLAHPAWPATVPGLTAHLALIREVEKQPPSRAALLGSDPSGARVETYRELCAWGVVVPPSRRWPTEDGIRLVEGLERRASA